MQLEINFWTGCTLIGVFIVLVILSVYGLIVLAKGRDVFLGKHNQRETTIAGQPIDIRKAPKRFNHDFWETRHEEIERRLNLHASEIKEIQQSRATALEKINHRFERVMVGLASIAGKVGSDFKSED